MSVDALAVLHIERLVAPCALGDAIELPVIHRGDASIISTWTRIDALGPDEHALGLRKLMGPALDAHADPRGILFFPDVCEFRATTYDAIVREVAPAGFWTPKVGADHVPARYTTAAPGTHDALVAAMIERMGRDAALEFDLWAQMNVMTQLASPDAAAGWAARLETLARLMGSPEFAQRYGASVHRKVEADRAAEQARRESTRELQAHMARGEPLVSQAELGAFIDSGAGDHVLAGLDPTLRQALEQQLGAVDVDALPEGDLGKQLLAALRRTKT